VGTEDNNALILGTALVNQNWAWCQQNNLDFRGHLGIGNSTPLWPLTYLHFHSRGSRQPASAKDSGPCGTTFPAPFARLVNSVPFVSS